VPHGKDVFAERCARCHSSKLPTPPPDIAAIAIEEGGGCAGKELSRLLEQILGVDQEPTISRRKCWNLEAPRLPGSQLFVHRAPDSCHAPPDNACSPLATNALRGNIWDNFSSSSYKDLPSVGTITWYHPYTGEPRTYEMPAGGRGYTRPPSLISLWSTAPFLLTTPSENFNGRSFVKGRLATFQNSIEQMLWPEKRDKDELLGDKIPGRIDRTTETSYLRVSYGYLPDALQKLRGIARFFPWLIDEKTKRFRLDRSPKVLRWDCSQI